MVYSSALLILASSPFTSRISLKTRSCCSLHVRSRQRDLAVWQLSFASISEKGGNILSLCPGTQVSLRHYQHHLYQPDNRPIPSRSNRNDCRTITLSACCYPLSEIPGPLSGQFTEHGLLSNLLATLFPLAALGAWAYWVILRTSDQRQTLGSLSSTQTMSPRVIHRDINHNLGPTRIKSRLSTIEKPARKLVRR